MNVRIQSEGNGGYLIKARDSEGREAGEWFLVTDLGLVTKQGRKGLLVYAHTFSEDAPCEGARIIIYGENRRVIAEELQTITECSCLRQMVSQREESP